MTPLYKRNARGTLQVWEVRADGDRVFTRYGLHDGKQQEASFRCEPTNEGHVNARTAEAQATFEAAALWRKKQAREGYIVDPERAAGGITDQGGIAPMLALSWDKMQKRYRFPYDAQPKLDGVRCIAVVEDGEVTLWSRKRKPIFGVPHVVEAVRRATKGKGDLVLDGELYTPGMGFQRITSYVRTEKEPKEGHEQVQYHVYDLPRFESREDLDWTTRSALLKGIEANDTLRIVHTDTAKNFDDVQRLHDLWVAEGYEGAILRSIDAPYEAGKRSAHLIKVKRFYEDEFRIVDVKDGKGKFEGVAVFVCTTSAGGMFDCCAPGTLEDRRKHLERGEESIDKLLSVKYFGWTDDNLPRFPVGKAVRDYE